VEISCIDYSIKPSLPSFCRKYGRHNVEILHLISKNKIANVSLSKLDFCWGTLLTRLFGMVPEQSNSASYRARAAICAWCAEETASAEAAAALLYLERMWILAAEVAEVIEENKSRAPLASEPHRLSAE